ncbi:sirohydrochlorin chelatase [Limnofasciculus baicalensis]|uniref:Sirohydrochlorin chelatase n=1 Tax=Limnofasciculus baicalensis BBK-W-15 TaxID=2699891 RepID=A0AAE3GXL3_9CYAN|nr:sirohydrochlorin chelatase [Limnofasciculus baicalensis]MCP2731676.1 sirohydrochlorin chelatase [Limnofasciculus baicalensis BBK-W-15]
MLPSTAYLLVSHGSRDPRPQLGMEKLAELVRSRMGEGKKGKEKFSSYLPFYPSSGWGSRQSLLYSRYSDKVGTAIAISNAWTPLVETATLELGNFPLHEQIRRFANKALAYSYHQIQVLPLFLLRGVHVMEDIPQEIAIAQQRISDIVEIHQLPHLGSHPKLGQLLINQEEIADVEAKILVSHGTRRIGGNQAVEIMAQNLDAIAAYWSVDPMLPQQVKDLASKGYQEIGILPYFLFSGGITDAIAKTVTNLQQQFPQLHLKQGQPIGATPQLAELIVDLIANL